MVNFILGKDNTVFQPCKQQTIKINFYNTVEHEAATYLVKSETAFRVNYFLTCTVPDICKTCFINTEEDKLL